MWTRFHLHLATSDSLKIPKSLIPNRPWLLENIDFSNSSNKFFPSLYTPHKNLVWILTIFFITPLGILDKQRKKVGKDDNWVYKAYSPNKGQMFPLSRGQLLYIHPSNTSSYNQYICQGCLTHKIVSSTYCKRFTFTSLFSTLNPKNKFFLTTFLIYPLNPLATIVNKNGAKGSLWQPFLDRKFFWGTSIHQHEYHARLQTCINPFNPLVTYNHI